MQRPKAEKMKAAAALHNCLPDRSSRNLSKLEMDTTGICQKVLSTEGFAQQHSLTLECVIEEEKCTFKLNHHAHVHVDAQCW